MFNADINYGGNGSIAKESLNFVVEKILSSLKEAALPMVLNKEILKEVERELELRARL